MPLCIRQIDFEEAWIKIIELYFAILLLFGVYYLVFSKKLISKMDTFFRLGDNSRSKLLTYINSGFMVGITSHYSTEGMYMAFAFVLAAVLLLYTMNLKRKDKIKWLMHLPRKNGTTDAMVYCTGNSEGVEGLTSFKYRNMENLWGNVCVLVDGIRICDGEVSVMTDGMDMEKISYTVSFQDGTPSTLIGHTAFVSKMGFDAENSLIMLPVETGMGASPTTGYVDLWAYPKSSQKSDLVLTYGLTWDLRNYAGLFAYRVASASTKAPENGSRLIYIPLNN